MILSISPRLLPYIIFTVVFLVPCCILLTIGLTKGYEMMDNPNYILKNGRYVKRDKVDKIVINIEYNDESKEKEKNEDSES